MLDHSECDGPLKQIMWSLYQSESFAPNDTRVATKRLSEQGLRAVLKRLAHLTSSSAMGHVPTLCTSPSGNDLLAAVRKAIGTAAHVDVMPPPEVVHLGRLHRIFGAEAFHTRCWVAMVAGKPLSSTNWTAFGAAFLLELKATLAAEWRDQVQQQHQPTNGNAKQHHDDGTMDAKHHTSHRRHHHHYDASLSTASDHQRAGGLGGDNGSALVDGLSATTQRSQQPSPRLTVERRSKSPAVSELPGSSGHSGVPLLGNAPPVPMAPAGADAGAGATPTRTDPRTRQQTVAAVAATTAAAEEPRTIELALSPLVAHGAEDVSNHEDSPKILGMVRRPLGVVSPVGPSATAHQADTFPAPGGPRRATAAAPSLRSNDATCSTASARTAENDARVSLASARPGMPVFMPSPSVSQPQHSSPPPRPRRRGDGDRTPSACSSASVAACVAEKDPPAASSIAAEHSIRSASAVSATPLPTLRPQQQRHVAGAVPEERETFEAGPAAASDAQTVTTAQSQRHQHQQQQPHPGDASTTYTFDFGACSPVLAPASSARSGPRNAPRATITATAPHGSWASNSYEPSLRQKATTSSWSHQQLAQRGHHTPLNSSGGTRLAHYHHLPYGAVVVPPPLPEETLYDARYDADVNQRVRNHCVALFHADQYNNSGDDDACWGQDDVVGGGALLDDSFGLYPIGSESHDGSSVFAAARPIPLQGIGANAAMHRCAVDHEEPIHDALHERCHDPHQEAPEHWHRRTVQSTSSLRPTVHAVTATIGTPIPKASFFHPMTTDNDAPPPRCCPRLQQQEQAQRGAPDVGGAASRPAIGRSSTMTDFGAAAASSATVTSGVVPAASAFSSAPAEPLSEPPSRQQVPQTQQRGHRPSSNDGAGGPSSKGCQDQHLRRPGPRVAAPSPPLPVASAAASLATRSSGEASSSTTVRRDDNGSEAGAPTAAPTTPAAKQLRVPLRTIALQELFPTTGGGQPTLKPAAIGAPPGVATPRMAVPVGEEKNVQSKRRAPPPPPSTRPRSTSPSTGRTSSPSLRVPASRPKSPVQTLAA